MPTALQGFFIAALFGAILSTFNSFLNSAATIYCKDLLPSISKKQRTDQELIVYAKKVSTIMAIVTMIIGPLLMFGTDGIFLITKRFAGFVNFQSWRYLLWVYLIKLFLAWLHVLLCLYT